MPHCRNRPLALLPNGTARDIYNKLEYHSYPKVGCVGFLASRQAWSDIRAYGYPSTWQLPRSASTITKCAEPLRCRIRKSTTIPTIKRCRPKTLTTTNCSGQNKDFVRKPILPRRVYHTHHRITRINTDCLRSSDNKELLAVLIRVILW